MTTPSKVLTNAVWGNNYNPTQSANTFNSQSTFFLPYTHPDEHVTFLYMGDRWNKARAGGVDQHMAAVHPSCYTNRRLEHSVARFMVGLLAPFRKRVVWSDDRSLCERVTDCVRVCVARVLGLLLSERARMCVRAGIVP